MRKRIIAALLVANAGLLGFTGRALTQDPIQPAPGDAKGCCKHSVEGVWYCCADCCWKTSSNCKTDSECAT